MRKGIKLIIATAMTAVLLLGAVGCGNDDTDTSNSSATAVQSDPMIIETDENAILCCYYIIKM